MKIVVLDAGTLGGDLPLERLGSLNCEVEIFSRTAPEQVAGRIEKCDIIILNKVKLGPDNLAGADSLRLICIAATGYDNIDVKYCSRRGISVCNVAGYSTDSVAQVTAATVLELATHIRAFNESVVSGEYTASGLQNKLTPVYHEIAGRTWGIVGCGNIGGRVARIAEAFGCKVIVYKRRPDRRFECVALEELCRRSDIITVHTPLNAESCGLIGKNELSMMKDTVILVNEARGAVLDEAAVCDAVENGVIGAFGCDVYSAEPLPETHPFQRIKALPNVCLTPHMAWGAYEARLRCLEEIIENIKAYINGKRRNAVN